MVIDQRTLIPLTADCRGTALVGGDYRGNLLTGADLSRSSLWPGCTDPGSFGTGALRCSCRTSRQTHHELAAATGTIAYETVTRLPTHVPRNYLVAAP